MPKRSKEHLPSADDHVQAFAQRGLRWVRRDGLLSSESKWVYTPNPGLILGWQKQVKKDLVNSVKLLGLIALSRGSPACSMKGDGRSEVKMIWMWGCSVSRCATWNEQHKASSRSWIITRFDLAQNHVSKLLLKPGLGKKGGYSKHYRARALGRGNLRKSHLQLLKRRAEFGVASTPRLQRFRYAKAA